MIFFLMVKIAIFISGPSFSTRFQGDVSVSGLTPKLLNHLFLGVGMNPALTLYSSSDVIKSQALSGKMASRVNEVTR
jgi:hypothetical protein